MVAGSQSGEAERPHLWLQLWSGENKLELKRGYALSDPTTGGVIPLLGYRISPNSTANLRQCSKTCAHGLGWRVSHFSFHQSQGAKENQAESWGQSKGKGSIFHEHWEQWWPLEPFQQQKAFARVPEKARGRQATRVLCLKHLQGGTVKSNVDGLVMETETLSEK